MRSDEKGSDSTLPRGEYSAAPAQYTPKLAADTTTLPPSSVESVRLVAVAEKVTLSYDPGEYATRRMIRKLNER